MKILTGVAGLALASTFAFSTYAAKPLVDSEWLVDNLNTPKTVFLDVRGKLAGKSRADYLAGHVPGAVYTNYLKDGWRMKDKNGTPGQLSSVAQLEALIGGLGINNETHVVIIPQGSKALDVATGTRIYWTFKILGHDNVSLLDGGYANYARLDAKTGKPVNPIEVGANTPVAEIFEANLRKDMLLTKSDVVAAVSNGTALVDHRPSPQYLGLAKHGAAKRFGTIPGARNLPENWLTVQGGGQFRNVSELRQLVDEVKLDANAPQINFCNTGHWASLGWFTSHELLGNKKAKLYDGSLVEWTADKKLPIERKILLN